MAKLLGLFLFTAGVSCAPDPLKEDYFHWFLETQRNPKIDPCENFFRHVCPVGISQDDALAFVNQKLILRWTLNGQKILEDEQEWEVLKMANFSTVEAELLSGINLSGEVKQQPKSAGEQKEAAKIEINLAVVYALYFHTFRSSTEQLFDKLPLRISMLYDVMKNPENPLFGANLTRIRQVSSEMKQYILKKVQASDEYSNAFKARIEVVIKSLLVKTAFLDEAEGVIQMYKRMLTNLRELKRLNVGRGQIGLHLKGLAEGVSNITDSHTFLINNHAVINSLNVMDHVTMMEAILLPTFMPNASIITVLAQYAYALGHEIGHSFVKPSASFFYLDPTYFYGNDPTYKKQMDCLRRKMEKTCVLWGETTCESGLLTLLEDGPDDFSMSASYEMLKGYLGSDAMKEYEYEDLKITKEQLFFYSTAILWCFPYHTTQQTKHDPHSGNHARINGMFSVMPEFHKAFNCHKHQLMVQPDRCSFYGKKNTAKNEP